MDREAAERAYKAISLAPLPENGAETILANTPFLLTRCSSDLRYLFISEACARMVGRRPEEVVGKKIVDIIGETGFQAILPHVNAVLSGRRVEYETEMHYKDVGLRLVHVIYTPEKDEFGHVRGWIASITDITEKRDAQRRSAADLRAMTLLREVGSECVRDDLTVDQCLHRILDAAIAITGAVKGTLRLLDPARGLLTLAAQRGFEEPFLNFFAAMRVEDSAYAAAMKSSERVIIEDMRESGLLARHPAKQVLLDAGVHAVTSTPLLASTGNLLGMISVHFAMPHRPHERELRLMDLLARQAADFLERKRAEAVHQELATIVEASRDAIWRWTIDGTITSWNGEAERMLGYRPEEILGKSFLTLIPPDRVKGAQELSSKLHQGQGLGPLETVRVHKNGTSLSVEVTVSPIRNSEGKVIAAATVCRDITARKQAAALIAADLRDMTRLNLLGNQLVRDADDVDKSLAAVLDTAIAITEADKGNVQLLDADAGALTIAVQRGFERPFLEFFEYVRDDASACAAAMRSGVRVIVEDVQESEIFAGQPSKDILIGAGVRAVISTPLISSAGTPLGMISTHFGRPHKPEERELHLIDLLARQTADFLERKRAEEIQHTLIGEIQHRSNNLLAIIQAIASRSLSGDYTLAQAKAAFEARLHALARANRQLTKANWIGADLSEIVRSEMQPFAEHAVVDGGSTLLSPKHAQNFALALHELATNAAKYGALSNGRGKVEIFWAVARQGKSNSLKFKWRELGGPPVNAPRRQGFGTVLLKATFPDARIGYAVDGLSCEIDVLLGEDRPRPVRPDADPPDL